jgi:predicted metalloprotease
MAGFVDSTALGRLMPLSFNHGGLKVIAAWFVYTGYKTAAVSSCDDFRV